MKPGDRVRFRHPDVEYSPFKDSIGTVVSWPSNCGYKQPNNRVAVLWDNHSYTLPLEAGGFHSHPIENLQLVEQKKASLYERFLHLETK